jgi:hypothetical protein
MSDLAEALESMADAMNFCSRDWSLHHRDAWLYALIVGWDDAALSDLMKEHGWEPKTVVRLKRLHRAVREERDGEQPEPLYCLACKCETVNYATAWKTCCCHCHDPEQR